MVDVGARLGLTSCRRGIYTSPASFLDPTHIEVFYPTLSLSVSLIPATRSTHYVILVASYILPYYTI